MKVFISWSGDRSRRVAESLRAWLGDVLQGVEPWISTHDIAPGANWTSVLGKALDGCTAGILCVTPENLRQPWLLFEGGALARSFDSSRLIPYAFGVAPDRITPPISMFQCATATRDGTLRLLGALNLANPPIPHERLERTFAKFWPDLEAALERIAEQAAPEGDQLRAPLSLISESAPIGVLRIESGNGVGKMFIITEEWRELRIGRSTLNAIVLDSPFVARYHLILRVTHRDDSVSRQRLYAFTISDCGSTNGTALNGLQLPLHVDAPLSNGDLIQLGALRLRFYHLSASSGESRPTHA